MLSRDLCQSVHTEYDEDGFLVLMHDAYGEKLSGVHGGEVHWEAGGWYRPRDPDTDPEGNPTKGCTVWQTWEGSQNHIELGSDPRAVPKLPRAKKGGRGIYAHTPHAQLPYAAFDGDDGSFTIYVPYDWSGDGPDDDTPGKAMAITVDVSQPGQERIQFIHGSGSSITMMPDGSILAAPSDKGASIEVKTGGEITINGNTTIQGAVLMGNPSTGVPVSLAPLVQAYFTALETAIATALTTVGVGPAANGPGAAAAFNGIVAGLSAQKAAIAALLTKAA